MSDSDMIERKFDANIESKVCINTIPTTKSWVHVLGHKLIINNHELFIFTVNNSICYLCDLLTGEKIDNFNYDNSDEFDQRLIQVIGQIGSELLLNLPTDANLKIKHEDINFKHYEELLGSKPPVVVVDNLEDAQSFYQEAVKEQEKYLHFKQSDIEF